LRYRADGRARVRRAVSLLEGDCRTHAGNGVDLRPMETVKELPCIGAKGFDVASAALGVDRVKRQGRLPRSRYARDGDKRIVLECDIKVLEIVFADASKAQLFLLLHRDENSSRNRAFRE